MIQNDLKWYEGNGFTETVLAAATEITALVEKYYEMTFDEMFICNVQRDGQEEYPSLWLFTEQDVVECKNFLTRVDIDIARYKGAVKYVNIMADKTDSLINPTQASTVRLSVSLVDDIKCYFDAKGANCQRLSEIAKHFLKEYKKGR